MLRTVLIFGFIAGGIILALGTLLFNVLELNAGSAGMLAGYAMMLIAFSMIYIGVRRYRSEQVGEQISFGKAFQVGLGITLVASVIYVASWMLSYYYGDGAVMMESYFEVEVANITNGNLPEAEKAQKIQEMKDFKVQYEQPFYMAMITFTEILPVGLLVSLITAWILRTKSPQQQPTDA